MRVIEAENRVGPPPPGDQVVKGGDERSPRLSGFPSHRLEELDVSVVDVPFFFPEPFDPDAVNDRLRFKTRQRLLQVLVPTPDKVVHDFGGGRGAQGPDGPLLFEGAKEDDELLREYQEVQKSSKEIMLRLAFYNSSEVEHFDERELWVYLQ